MRKPHRSKIIFCKSCCVPALPLIFMMITFAFFVTLTTGRIEADDKNHTNSIATPIALNQELRFWEPLLWLTTRKDIETIQNLSDSMNEHYELLAEFDQFITIFNRESTQNEALAHARTEHISPGYRNEQQIEPYKTLSEELKEKLKWYGAFKVMPPIEARSEIEKNDKAIFTIFSSKDVEEADKWKGVAGSISEIQRIVNQNRNKFIAGLRSEEIDKQEIEKITKDLKNNDAVDQEAATLNLLAENAYQCIVNHEPDKLVANGIKIIASFRKKSAEIALKNFNTDSKLKIELESFRQELKDLSNSKDSEVMDSQKELMQLAKNLSENEIKDNSTLILNYENFFYPGPFLKAKAGEIDLDKAANYKTLLTRWARAKSNGKEKLSSLLIDRASTEGARFTYQRLLKYKMIEHGFEAPPQKLKEFIQVAEDIGLTSINTMAEDVKNKVKVIHTKKHNLSTLSSSIQELKKYLSAGALSVLVQDLQLELNSSPLHFRVLNINDFETGAKSSKFKLDLVCDLGTPQQPFATISVSGLQVDMDEMGVNLLTDQSHIRLASHGQSEQTCGSCNNETTKQSLEIDATKTIENVHPQLATLSRVLGRQWLMRLEPLPEDSKSLVDSFLEGKASLKISPRLFGDPTATFTIPVNNPFDPAKTLDTQFKNVVSKLTPLSEIDFRNKATSEWELKVNDEYVELRTNAIKGSLNNIVDENRLKVIIPGSQQGELLDLQVTSAFIRIEKTQPDVELYGVRYLQEHVEKELIINSEGLIKQARNIATQQAEDIVSKAKKRAETEVKNLISKELEVQTAMVKGYLQDLKSKLRLKSVEVSSTQEANGDQLIAKLTPDNSECSVFFTLKWPVKNAWPPQKVKLENKEVATCWARGYLNSLLKFTDNEIIVINKVNFDTAGLDVDATVHLNKIDPVFEEHKLLLKATIPFTREMTACDIKISDPQPLGEITTENEMLKIALGRPRYECGIFEVPVECTSSIIDSDWSVSGKILLVNGKFTFEDADFVYGIINDLKIQFVRYITDKSLGVIKKLGLPDEDIVNSVAGRIEIKPEFGENNLIPQSLNMTLKPGASPSIELPPMFGIEGLKLTVDIDLKMKSITPTQIEADKCNFMGNAFKIKGFLAKFPQGDKPLVCEFVSMSVGNIFKLTDGSLIIPQNGKGEFGGGGKLNISGSNLGGVTLRINPRSGSFFIALQLDAGGVTNISGELGYGKDPLKFHLAASGPLFGTGECGFEFDANLDENIYLVGLSYPLTFCIVDGKIRLAETQVDSLKVGAAFSEAKVHIHGVSLNTGDPIVILGVSVASFGSMSVSIPVNDIDAQTILDIIKALMFPKINLAFNERFSVGRGSNKPGSKPRNDNEGKETPKDENYLKPPYSEDGDSIDLYYTWPEYFKDADTDKIKIHLWHATNGIFDLGNVVSFCTGDKKLTHPIKFTSSTNNLHLFKDLSEYESINADSIEYPRIILNGVNDDGNGKAVSLILFPHKGVKGDQIINAHLLEEEKITWCSPPESASAKSEYQYLDKEKHWSLQVQNGKDVINFKIEKVPSSIEKYHSTAALTNIPDNTHIVREKGRNGVNYILLETKADFTDVSRGWIWLIKHDDSGKTIQKLISNPLSKEFGTSLENFPYILITEIERRKIENQKTDSFEWQFEVQVSDSIIPAATLGPNKSYTRRVDPGNAVIYQNNPVIKYGKDN